MANRSEWCDDHIPVVADADDLKLPIGKGFKPVVPPLADSLMAVEEPSFDGSDARNHSDPVIH
jgi:hypothetical protein